MSLTPDMMPPWELRKIIDQQADTITRLTDRITELEGVLRLFECDCNGAYFCSRREHCRNYIARAALEGK